ncbi:MAG TPA: hypothetical protein VK919_09970 [Solirubrobacterales bacterium]|nr:hypothetical protein [Solirubrobacterales bacterium]
MSSAEQIDRAAALISRLIEDAEFRARFRRDPAAACRAHGLPEIADELSAGAGMRTLDERESKSSLAGVVMAAALEGVSAYQLVERFGPSLATDAAGALNRALTLSHLEAIKGGLAPEPPASTGPAPPPLPAAEPAGAIPGMEGPAEPVPDADAAEGETGGGGDGGMRAGPAASVESLLNNPNLDLPPQARADLEAGIVDPRLVGVLGRITEDHEIGISVIKTGHGKFTSSGYVSNHFHGRGLDIASVDGQPVSPGNVGARDVSTLLAELEGPLRATEIGTPFPISEPGFFTDGAHQDHIHVAFDTEAPKGLKLPAAAADHGHAGGDEHVEAGGEPASGFEPAEVERGRRHSVHFMPAVEGGGEDAPVDDADPRFGSGFDLDAAAADYPGDNAGREALARWLGRHAYAAGLPRELPVMAALVESNVANLNYGDADSVGFFQMRVGIWNRGEYAGYPNRPELQLKWFIDTALAVKDQQGISGKDPSTWGEWIADVERPAEQYRGRYQPRLPEARALLR